MAGSAGRRHDNTHDMMTCMCVQVEVDAHRLDGTTSPLKKNPPVVGKPVVISRGGAGVSELVGRNDSENCNNLCRLGEGVR